MEESGKRKVSTNDSRRFSCAGKELFLKNRTKRLQYCISSCFDRNMRIHYYEKKKMFLKSICTRAVAPRSLHTHFVIAHRLPLWIAREFLSCVFHPLHRLTVGKERIVGEYAFANLLHYFFFFLGVHFPFSIHTGGKWLRCFPCLHCHCLIYISLVLLKQQRHFASLRTDLFVAFHAHFLFHNYLKNSKSMYCTKCLCRHVSQLCAIIC